MRSYKVFIVYCLLNWALAQGQETKVAPRVESLTLDEEEVTLVHLTPGYATSVRMPEEITSVVVGDPAKFKAEHSESEPRLVFIKPVTTKPAKSNALITMKSGREVSLHLVSAGSAASGESRVDFVVEYRAPRSLMLEHGDGQGFFVPQTDPVAQPANAPVKVDWVAEAMERQKAGTPLWQGKELMAAVGSSSRQGTQTAVGFSVLNESKRTIELLPPQLEIGGQGGGKQTKAEPVALSEYRMTARRLGPGERSDGVAVFERPAFKESSEQLELRLAQTDRVDRALILPVPFVSENQGGAQ